MAQIELIVCRQHDRTHPDGYDSSGADRHLDDSYAEGIPMIEILGKKKPARRLAS